MPDLAEMAYCAVSETLRPATPPDQHWQDRTRNPADELSWFEREMAHGQGAKT